MTGEITMAITILKVRARPPSGGACAIPPAEVKQGSLMMLFRQSRHIACRYISAADDLRLRGVEPKELTDLYLPLHSSW